MINAIHFLTTGIFLSTSEESLSKGKTFLFVNSSLALNTCLPDPLASQVAACVAAHHCDIVWPASNPGVRDHSWIPVLTSTPSTLSTLHTSWIVRPRRLHDICKYFQCNIAMVKILLWMNLDERYWLKFSLRQMSGPMGFDASPTDQSDIWSLGIKT